MSDDVKPEGGVLGAVESAIYGIFTLAGKVIRTVPAFAMTPDVVWRDVRFGRARRYQQVQFAPPFTYLTLAVTLFLVLFVALVQVPTFEMVDINTPFLGLFIEGVQSVDQNKLLVVILPLILAVALYSWTVATWRVGGKFTFERSAALTAYLAGSVVILATLCIPFVPVLVLSKEEPDPPPSPYAWLIIIPLILLLGMLKCLHSYLHLLRRELDVSRTRILALWLRDVAVYVALQAMIVILLFPLRVGRFVR